MSCTALRGLIRRMPGAGDSGEPERLDNGKARQQADAVLLMTSGIKRSEWNEEW